MQDRPLSGPHNIWSSVQHNERDVKAGEIKVRLATQTYMVEAVKAKYHRNTVSDICKLCNNDTEDIKHFLLECKDLDRCREKHISKLAAIVDEIDVGLLQKIKRDGNLLQLVLDCSKNDLGIDRKMHIRIETVTRKMCYDLHMERTRRMAGGE